MNNTKLKQTYSIYAQSSDINQLRQLSGENNVSVSLLISNAIALYLAMWAAEEVRESND